MLILAIKFSIFILIGLIIGFRIEKKPFVIFEDMIKIIRNKYIIINIKISNKNLENLKIFE